MKRCLILAAAAGFAAAIGGEVFARYYLQLGHPPLSVSDPKIEYMFAPNQDVWRFGNHIVFNEWGMRNYSLAKEKPAGQLRFLVLGDSVLNGGNLTDHNDLATTIASKENALFMNASAGSWGPENMAAYVQRFSTFDADMIILVLSGHDARDVPTFEPLDSDTHPTTAPALALVEGITRYLPRYLPDSDPSPPAIASSPSDFRSAATALAAISDLVRGDTPVCVVLHPERHELRTGTPDVGFADIREAATGAIVVDQAEILDPDADYRDEIHPSLRGQRMLALSLRQCAEHVSASL